MKVTSQPSTLTLPSSSGLVRSYPQQAIVIGCIAARVFSVVETGGTPIRREDGEHFDGFGRLRKVRRPAPSSSPRYRRGEEEGFGREAAWRRNSNDGADTRRQ